MSDRLPTEPVVAPRGAMRIGSFFGVPVFLSASWLIIAAFMTVAFADLFRRQVDGATGAVPYALAALFAVLSALCVLIHELGHVAVALALGLRVRRVFVYLLGGVSEIDPEPQRAGEELVVSAAGPLASAAIAGLAWLGWSISPDGSAIAVELQILVWSNLAIAIFNALPGLPLDGGRVLRAAIWAIWKSRVRGTIIAAWGGRVVAVAVAISGLLVTDGTGWQVVSVVFTAGLGAFLWFAAGHTINAARLSERLPGISAGALVRRAVYVHSGAPVAQALQQLWESGARSIVVVDSAGLPVAIVTESLVDRLAAGAQAWTSVADVSQPLSGIPRLPAGLRGRELLDVVTRHPAADYLVEIGDLPIGVMSAVDLRNALTRRSGAANPASSPV